MAKQSCDDFAPPKINKVDEPRSATVAEPFCSLGRRCRIAALRMQFPYIARGWEITGRTTTAGESARYV